LTTSSHPLQAASIEPVNAVVPPTLPQFDPRKAPFVFGNDGLPAVPAAQLTASALRVRFATPPVWTPSCAASRD